MGEQCHHIVNIIKQGFQAYKDCKRRWRSVKHNSSNVKHVMWYHIICLTLLLLCLTDLHLLLLYKHFGMEHLKLQRMNRLRR